MVTREWAETSSSGECAEQAGEPHESGLGRYVDCRVGGVVCVCRVLHVCELCLSA